MTANFMEKKTTLSQPIMASICTRFTENEHCPANVIKQNLSEKFRIEFQQEFGEKEHLNLTKNLNELLVFLATFDLTFLFLFWKP